MGTIDTRPDTTEELIARLLERVNTLEQRRPFLTDAEGRILFPAGIDSGDAGDLPDNTPPDPVSDVALAGGIDDSGPYLVAGWALPGDLTRVASLELHLSHVDGGETIDVFRTGIIDGLRLRGLEPDVDYRLEVYTVAVRGIRSSTGPDATAVTDPAGPLEVDAGQVSYDPAGSALEATDAQAALDELAGVTDGHGQTLDDQAQALDDHAAATAETHGIAAGDRIAAGSEVDTLGQALDDHADDGDTHVAPQTVTDLALTVSDPPTQAETQEIADKLDELLAALRTAGVLTT